MFEYPLSAEYCQLIEMTIIFDRTLENRSNHHLLLAGYYMELELDLSNRASLPQYL